MNWKQKLTSRKFWTAIASFVALLVLAFGGAQATATQVTAIIMAGASVIAYIVGEGLVDAASAGAQTIVCNTPAAGQQAATPPNALVVAKTDLAAPTGTAQAAAVMQNTAEPPESRAAVSNAHSAV